MKNNDKESGQIVLMVLLTMVVGLTIALGIFADSLTDTAVTVSQENSEKAFNLAEAGIENLLAGKNPRDIGGEDFKIETKTEEDKFLETYVKQNETVEVKLTDEDNNTANKVDIYWTDKTDSEQNPVCGENKPAGLILTIISKNISGVVSTRYIAYGPYHCIVNGFSVTGDTSADYLSYIKNLGLNSDDKLLRIRPVFNNAKIKVNPTGNGQITQQYRYESLATANDTMESRKIEVVRTLPSLPEVFDYTLFSNGTINK